MGFGQIETLKERFFYADIVEGCDSTVPPKCPLDASIVQDLGGCFDILGKFAAQRATKNRDVSEHIWFGYSRIVKTYPRTRLRRFQGAKGAFWTLFRKGLKKVKLLFF